MTKQKQRLVAALKKREQREVPKELYEAMRSNVVNIFRNALYALDGLQTVETVQDQVLDGLEELVAEGIIRSGTCTGVCVANTQIKADIYLVLNVDAGGVLVFNCASHLDRLPLVFNCTLRDGQA